MREDVKDILLGLSIGVIMVMIMLGTMFFMDRAILSKPCDAHRISFPIATPFDAQPHLTDADLQRWYETYRRMYFGTQMPDAKVIWADLTNLMGRTNRTPEGLFEIRVDRKSNPDAKEALMTLLHEMCHVDMWDREFDEHGSMWQYDMHRLADEDAFEDLW